MVAIITPGDLEPFADIAIDKAEAMIEDALAMATRVAPCITEPDFDQQAAVKAVLRGAILRWDESGQGGLTAQQVTAGPYSQSNSFDTRTTRKTLFWPSEIEALQELCSEGGDGAFVVDMVNAGAWAHASTCSLVFGANFCSCGADINNGWPLWE